MSDFLSKTFVIFCFFGALFVAIQITISSVKCPPPTVIYKYIPRDFNIDNNYPDRVSSNFKDMFQNPTPYIVSLGSQNLKT